MHKEFFLLHAGHLLAKADKIAQRHGGRHVNINDCGRARGWFEVPSTGRQIDQYRMAEITKAIEAAGGVEALRRKRPLPPAEY